MVVCATVGRDVTVKITSSAANKKPLFIAKFSLDPVEIKTSFSNLVIRRFKHSGSLLLPKSRAIFARGDECLHHLSLVEVAIEIVKLRQPELIAIVIVVRRISRIAAQVSEVLHQHESRG